MKIHIQCSFNSFTCSLFRASCYRLNIFIINADTRRARSCSESVEDLGKTITGISSNYNNNNNNNHCRERETRKDYQALREKFGAEFHRKLVEWERLKSARNARDGLPLNEERLAPEFRKKLQDWKRTKKGRRSGAVIEQQRVSRRRLTDWQLWRSSSSKPELRCYNVRWSHQQLCHVK